MVAFVLLDGRRRTTRQLRLLIEAIGERGEPQKIALACGLQRTRGMNANYQMMDLTGQRIGNYVILDCIGEGGMGTVYLAVHPVIGRQVALKVLQPHLAKDQEMGERFIREARAASRISNPGIVKILDLGYTAGGLPYLVMEYIKGRPLSDFLKTQGRLSVLESIRIAREIACALSAAHQKQVIHRDLKPENIMRLNAPDESGLHIKIVDFGIACIDTKPGMERLTRAGAFLGTPRYMAPEVILDPRQASERSDAYALGVVLYQMLVGETPFTGPTPTAVLFKVINDDPPVASERAPEIPPALCALIKRLLAKRPEERIAMQALGKALGELERALACAVRKPSASWQRRLTPTLPMRLLAWTVPSLIVGALALAFNYPLAQYQQAKLIQVPGHEMCPNSDSKTTRAGGAGTGSSKCEEWRFSMPSQRNHVL